MKSYASKDPIGILALPAGAPPHVAELKERFDKISRDYVTNYHAVRDAERDEIPTAISLDVQEEADAIADGETLKDPGRHEREARAKHEQLARRSPSLRLAVDQLGNQLAAQVGAASDEWTARLREQAVEATARADTALAQARQALDDAGRLQSAIRFLEQFDAPAATIGQQGGYHGKPAPFPLRERIPAGANDAATLLRVAASALAPEPEPKPFEAGARIASTKERVSGSVAA